MTKNLKEFPVKSEFMYSGVSQVLKAATDKETSALMAIPGEDPIFIERIDVEVEIGHQVKVTLEKSYDPRGALTVSKMYWEATCREPLVFCLEHPIKCEAGSILKVGAIGSEAFVRVTLNWRESPTLLSTCPEDEL